MAWGFIVNTLFKDYIKKDELNLFNKAEIILDAATEDPETYPIKPPLANIHSLL